MNPDFLVIGAGVAGMRAAIELAEAGTVLVVAKDSLRESSSEYAQGGIAVALSDDDEVELHEQDTLYAGDGLCDRAAVRTLVEEGPAAIQELIEWGAEFDREGSKLAFTREGAHSRNRILHAHGDSTGREIARTLYQQGVHRCPMSTFRSFAATTELLVDDGVSRRDDLRRQGEREFADSGARRAAGHRRPGPRVSRIPPTPMSPPATAWRWPSAPARRSATSSSCSFIRPRWHVEGAPRFLLSEALRGEGALLRNTRGERFMERYHPLTELAPRDVVARAIVSEMTRTGVAARVPGSDASRRGLHSRALPANLRDLPALRSESRSWSRRRWLPRRTTRWAACGPIWTAAPACRGLFAAGEAACTGVHGANRLASNSLLEGVVFGVRAGRAMREAAARTRRVVEERAALDSRRSLADGGIQRIAWEKCGIVRSAEGLAARHRATGSDCAAIRRRSATCGRSRC